MDTLQNALAKPHSLLARRELAQQWEEISDPRAQLIRCHLIADSFDDNISEPALRRAGQLITKHGPAWAGPVVNLVDNYEFSYGMVSWVSVSADRFIDIAEQLVGLAPIVEITLLGPANMPAICELPQLAQISALRFTPGPWLTDAAVAALIASPFATGLRVVELSGGEITPQGATALAEWPNIRDIAYVDVTGNRLKPAWFPGCPYTNVNDRLYVIGGRGIKPLEEAELAHAHSYNTNGIITWPPSSTEFSYYE